MSSPSKAQGASDVIPLEGERRQHLRQQAKVKVDVIRENDNWRNNLPVELIDISIAGLGFLAGVSFSLEEHVRIRMRNDTRRVVKEVRGVVRWMQLTDTGKFRVGIVLKSRLTALDIQLLKQVGTSGASGQKVWI